MHSLAIRIIDPPAYRPTEVARDLICKGRCMMSITIGTLRHYVSVTQASLSAHGVENASLRFGGVEAEFCMPHGQSFPA